jgi:hypothetical protein
LHPPHANGRPTHRKHPANRLIEPVNPMLAPKKSSSGIRKGRNAN